jgi:universal stress protein E
MFDKVLVLADHGDPNHPALRRALACTGQGGEVEIFDAVYEPMLEGYLGNKAVYEPLRSRVLAERRARAAALAHAVESWGVRGTAHAIWAHPLHRAVADEVAARGIGLVVIAPARAQGGLSHSEWQLVTSCPAPVLVVKSDAQSPYRSIVAAVDPFHSHAKPADLDGAILRHAKALQADMRAALTVLHCYTPVEYFGADLGQPPAHDPAFADGRQEALQALCRDAGLPPAAAKLVAGAPHTVLESLAERGEADLIVMGALARGRFAELVVGNTAERVLHHGQPDVLIVKPQDPARVAR